MKRMKKAKERVIYDNYDLSEMFDEQKKFMEDDYGEEVSDDEVWEAIYDIDRMTFEEEFDALERFFFGTDDDRPTFILFGNVGRWNGVSSGFNVFNGEDFEKTYFDAIKDCDFVKIWDENGHLYIECSHHDGTNNYEIKQLTERGKAYLENWENSWNDKRSAAYVLDKLVKRYSVLPRYAEKKWGSKRVEWEAEK